MAPKNRISTAKVGLRLAAGTALLADPASGQTATDRSRQISFDSASSDSAAAQPEKDLFQDIQSSEAIAGTAIQRIVAPGEMAKWDYQDQRRFKELVVKRAKGEATAEDQEEFSDLQARRRVADYSPTTKEILAECRRRRMVNEIIQVLQRHVRVFPPKNQERIRSFGHAE